MQITKEAYEKRCLELARLFGSKAETFECIDSTMTEFFEIVGYKKVCELLIIKELDQRKRHTTIARKYCFTSDQIDYIQKKRKARSTV